MKARGTDREAFQGKSVKEIDCLPVWEGNKQKKLGYHLKIEETSAELPSIIINGDAN